MNQTAIHIPTRQYPVRELIPTFQQTLRTWHQRSISRSHLSQASPRILADIGISEAQRDAEVSKPFWRA